MMVVKRALIKGNRLVKHAVLTKKDPKIPKINFTNRNIDPKNTSWK
jgi:hypothetical protein